MTTQESTALLTARSVVFAYYREEEPGTYTYAAIESLMKVLRDIDADALEETIRLARAQQEIDQARIEASIKSR